MSPTAPGFSPYAFFCPVFHSHLYLPRSYEKLLYSPAHFWACSNYIWLLSSPFMCLLLSQILLTPSQVTDYVPHLLEMPTILVVVVWHAYPARGCSGPCGDGSSPRRCRDLPQPLDRWCTYAGIKAFLTQRIS